MALINCPECSKEISDKVKACPHCGYPIIIDEEPQRVEISSVNIKIEEKNRKKVIGMFLGIVIIIILVGSAYVLNKTSVEKKNNEAYIANINLIMDEMLTSGGKAEEVLNIVYKVWYNTIYDIDDESTNKYTGLGRATDDFNISLEELYLDGAHSAKVEGIRLSEEKIQKLVKSTIMPNNDYEKLQDSLMQLNSDYQGVISLAVSPSGSLQSFSDNKQKKIDDFLESYKKVKMLIPEKIK